MEKRIRKPRGIRGFGGDVYADFNKDGRVYIGGSYHGAHAQIHLSENDVIFLSAWLEKASKYLKAKQGKKNRRKSSKTPPKPGKES